MTHVSFTMTRPVAELLWGQILSDALYYDQEDAKQFITLLKELGYDFKNEDFQASYASHLVAVANGTAPQPLKAV